MTEVAGLFPLEAVEILAYTLDTFYLHCDIVNYLYFVVEPATIFVIVPGIDVAATVFVIAIVVSAIVVLGVDVFAALAIVDVVVSPVVVSFVLAFLTADAIPIVVGCIFSCFFFSEFAIDLLDKYYQLSCCDMDLAAFNKLVDHAPVLLCDSQ